MMMQREFDGVEGSGTLPRSEMKVYLSKDNLCSLYQIEKIINSNLIW
jgi:hypothetical protein